VLKRVSAVKKVVDAASTIVSAIVVSSSPASTIIPAVISIARWYAKPKEWLMEYHQLA
jgi:hypothetical protein